MKSLKLVVTGMIMAFLFLPAFAANMTPQDPAKQGRIIEYHAPQIGSKFAKAIRRGKITISQFRHAYRDLQNNDLTTVSLLQKFESGRIGTKQLQEGLANRQERGDDTFQIESEFDYSQCRAFAEGAYWQCITSGGSEASCQADADAWYCSCMNGSNMGNGFCLIY